MPEWLQRLMDSSFLGTSVVRWLTAVLALVAVFFALKLAHRLAARRVAALAARRPTRPALALAEGFAQTKSFFFFAVAAACAALLLDLPADLEGIPGKVLVLATFLQAGVWTTRFIAAWVAHVPPAAGNAPVVRKALPHLLGLIARVVVWAIVVLLLLQNAGVEVTALVAGLGIGGIAVALAVQNVLGDLLASLSIALDEPFVPGDFIVVDSFSGTVEQIGLKTTRVRSLSGELIVFANSDLLKSRVRNFKHLKERRVVFTVGVTYATPAERLPEIAARLRAIVMETPGTRFDRAHLKELGETALVYEVVYIFESPDYNAWMDAHQHINVRIVETMAAMDVALALPTRTLRFEPPTPSSPQPRDEAA